MVEGYGNSGDRNTDYREISISLAATPAQMCGLGHAQIQRPGLQLLLPKRDFPGDVFFFNLCFNNWRVHVKISSNLI
jgi:hypothetical protein